MKLPNRYAVNLAFAMLTATGPVTAWAADALAARVNQSLERRGLGADALQVIDNLVRHEGPPPAAAPPLVRELLKQPLLAVDAAALFKRNVPEAVTRLVDAAAMQPQNLDTVDIVDLLTPYWNTLADAQHTLRAAAPGGIAAPAVIGSLNGRAPPAATLLGVMQAVDAQRLARANAQFIDATARFIAALRAAGHVRFPQAVTRLQSPIGVVVIGTAGDDVHAADAALIIDPGGNDRYTRALISGGGVSVIIDLGGDDRYEGTDLVVHGFSAIVDFAGNDRYVTAESGQGAAIAGVSLILDMAGDDGYEAGYFAQGAAAFGLGAVIDLAGNDRYQIRTSGQGYGMAGGVGLLWDRAGNDSYTAGGLPDAYERGGGISFAQGAAYGYRTSLGGGIGILRDDAGDDHYTAEMFAQGVGYYYGVGLLWDRGGNDKYQAVRYAQGNGVHEAVGVLHDESGNDEYRASFGVAQGMGLDLAVGVLYDGAGDDRYRGGTLVQGAATSNGIGVLMDGGGTDQWHADVATGWGSADWARGMPTLGLLLRDPTRAGYAIAGKPHVPAPESVNLGGPLARVHVLSPASPAVATGAANACPPADATTAAQDTSTLTIAGALSRAMPGLAGGKPDPAAYVRALQLLRTQLHASLLQLPRDDFNVLWMLGQLLPCTAKQAAANDVEVLWRDIEHMIGEETGHPFAAPLMSVLRERLPPHERLQPLLQRLANHPACSVRAGALRLMVRAAEEGQARSALELQANVALKDDCWRLQLAARDVLRQIEAPFDARWLPVFLRDAGAP